MKTSPLCLSLLLPLAAACGSGPDVSEIKSALDNPTGSINDKGGVTAAAQRQQSNGSAGSVGAINPFGGGALTIARAHERPSVQPAFALQAMKPFFDHVERRMGRSIGAQQLRTAEDFGSCFENAFAQTENFDPNGDSFDMKVDIDFDSCGDASLSGRMTLEMSGSIDVEGGRFEYEGSYVYADVCVKSGDDRVCQDGEMRMEGVGRVPTTGTTNDEFTMEIFSAWRIDTLVEADGKSYAFTNKGGLEMKLGGDDSSSVSFRMVVFVTLPSGEEVSYTLTIKADDASGSFSITGKDGSLTCTVDAAGNGSCTGDLDLEWTDADWDATYESYGG